MGHRPRVRNSTAPRADVRLVTPDSKLHIALNRVRSGVIVGRSHACAGNAHADYWALFDDAEHFRRCCDLDELRFAYPLVYIQLLKAFHDVYNQPAHADSAEGSGSDAGLFEEGDGHH